MRTDFCGAHIAIERKKFRKVDNKKIKKRKPFF
jgi:hypothetical protein